MTPYVLCLYSTPYILYVYSTPSILYLYLTPSFLFKSNPWVRPCVGIRTHDFWVSCMLHTFTYISGLTSKTPWMQSLINGAPPSQILSYPLNKLTDLYSILTSGIDRQEKLFNFIHSRSLIVCFVGLYLLYILYLLPTSLYIPIQTLEIIS